MCKTTQDGYMTIEPKGYEEMETKNNIYKLNNK